LKTLGGGFSDLIVLSIIDTLLGFIFGSILSADDIEGLFNHEFLNLARAAGDGVIIIRV